MERLALGLMGRAHQGLEILHDLRQAIQGRLRAEVLAVVARREPRDRGARRDVADHPALQDRKSTRLNSSHGYISYAVFCLKKKKRQQHLAFGPACQKCSTE